ncbi:MAG: 3-deoxy-D-manno-octulosonate 8-phosphate phosphatase [Bacteroidia bacterium]
MDQSIFAKLGKIRGFIFDVDGVMTDGSLIILEEGTMLRQLNIKDGFALSQAVKQHFQVGVISGSVPVGVDIRLEKLGIEDIYFDQEHKILAFEKFLLDHSLASTEILYMGDDLLDLPPMERSGLAACPADAVQEVKDAADIVTQLTGGKGCVREIIELVLKYQNKWDVKLK